MGRRKDNPELVEELIDGRWTIDDDEFESKFNSLSSNDQWKVADAIKGMEDELMSSIGDEDEDFLRANYCRGGELTED